MKKTIMLMALSLIMAASSMAQIGGSINGYVGGGLNLPLDELNSSFKPGYHGSAGIGFNVTPGLEIVARYTYFTFPGKDSVEFKSFTDSEGDFDTQEIGADIRASLAPPNLRLRPYALIGAGMAKMPQEDKFFYSIGLGFKITAWPRLDFFLEGRYSRVSVDNIDIGYVPVAMGVNVRL